MVVCSISRADQGLLHAPTAEVWLSTLGFSMACMMCCSGSFAPAQHLKKD